MLKRAKRIPAARIAVSVLTDKEIQQFIIDLNAVGQLFSQGLDSEGDLTGTYSVVTSIFDERKTAGEHYNFLDTGEFLESFSVKVFKDGSFVIRANTDKEEDDLIDKFGPLLGLTDESRAKLHRELLPKVIRKVWDFVQTGSII